MSTDATAQSALDDTAFFAAFLDTLIPPSAASESRGKLPGAGSLGLAPGVAAAIRSSAQLAPVVEAGLAAIRSEGFAALELSRRVELVEAQLGAHPDLIRAITTPLYYAYYQHPTVLIGLGVPPRPPFPEGYEVEATDPALLALLRSRT